MSDQKDDRENVVGIIWWNYKTKGRGYRIRGWGKDYIEIGQFVSSVKLSHEWDDWPWYGFCFIEPKDENEFIKKYSQFFMEPDKDDAKED